MKIEYHPLVPIDLREILEWYDKRSESASNRFFEDFEKTVEKLRNGLTQGIPIGESCFKKHLSESPSSLSYETERDSIYIFVLKHQKRHPNLGMRRSRPSQGK